MMENTEKLTVGQTVVSVLNQHKMGTVLAVLGENLQIRWDGEAKSVSLSETRVRPKSVLASLDTSWEIPFNKDFKKGDYLEVETQKHGVVRGAALTNWGSGTTGAQYEILTDDGKLLFLNSNFDVQTVLFRADIARGMEPKY